MTGSKMTTMTLKDMRAARERGETKSDLDRVQQMVRDGIAPAEDEDSPNAAASMRAEIEKRRRGRSSGSEQKVQVPFATIARYWTTSSPLAKDGKRG